MRTWALGRRRWLNAMPSCRTFRQALSIASAKCERISRLSGRRHATDESRQVVTPEVYVYLWCSCKVNQLCLVVTVVASCSAKEWRKAPLAS